MTDDLPEFEFSDELESEFEQMRASQAAERDAAAAAQVGEGAGENAAAQARAQASAGEGAAQGEAQFYAWQVCLADHAATQLMDADDYPNYLINRESITQMLGIGMASGRNALPADDAMFVVAISIQEGGAVKVIGPDHPRYNDVAAVVSEELLSNKDRGMVAQLPNGRLVAVKQPVDPSNL